MKLSKKLQSAKDEAQKHDSYWIEKAKLDFALDLERQRRVAGMNYAAIAETLKTSAAYISKIFRGDTNVTIESMVKLARATGGRLDIQIVDAVAEPVRWAAPRAGVGAPVTRTSGATIYAFPIAANHDAFREEIAA